MPQQKHHFKRQDRICIYCRAQKEARNFAREHIMPQAFGTFQDSDGRTTNHRVCKDCNEEMGEQIVNRFARESYEGFMRYTHGILSFDSDPDERRFRARLAPDNFRASFPSGSPLRHAKAERVYPLTKRRGERQTCRIIFPCQVLLWSPNSTSPTAILDREISNPEFEIADFEGTKERPAIVIAPDEGSRNSLMKACAARGLRIEEHVLIDPTEHVRGQLIYDSSVSLASRMVLNIAFNYLGVLTKDVPSFALQEAFDPVRSFVRYGTESAAVSVASSRDPILATESRHLMHTDAHQVVLYWGPRQRSILGRVSFFGQTFNHAVLASNYGGLWIPGLDRGIALDFRDRIVHEIRQVDLLPRVFGN